MTTPSGQIPSATILFNGLQITGLVLVSAVLGAAYFSRQVKRIKTWYAFLLSWVVYTTAFLLLPAKSFGFVPGQAYCLFQASVVYAVAPT